jgi:SAM-dependent methyltransferase
MKKKEIATVGTYVPKKEIKLLLGDTEGPSGWTTVDRNGGNIRIHLNQDTKLDMFENNSVSCIYSSHMIEHMEIESVQNIFNECYRILKPGGIIRTCCPNASQFIQEYKNNPDTFGTHYEYGVGSGRTYKQEVEMWTNILAMSPEAKNECLLPHNLLCAEFVCYCDRPQYGHTFDKEQFDIMINKPEEEFLEWVTSHYQKGRPAGHMTAFTPDKVKSLYIEAGFKSENTFEMEYRKSNILDIDAIDLELRKTISLYVEGIK